MHLFRSGISPSRAAHPLAQAALTIVLLCASAAAEIPPQLLARLAELPAGRALPVVVRFAERPDLERFREGRRSAPALIRHLKDLSDRGMALLSDVARNARPLWIIGGAVLDLDAASAQEVARLPFIASMEEDALVSTDAELFGAQADAHPSWGMEKILADSCWLLYGIDGAGILLGSMDTGVDVSHPSLGPKWLGGAHAWYDAIAGQPFPYDDLGHGTLTTGILVGGDGPGADTNDVGAAWGARFIAAKMLTGGFATNDQVIGAAQWMLDPDGDPATNDFPDVINNSWFSNTRGSTWFYDAAAAWRAAGIIPVFCAANFGPATSSTRSPGDYAICLSVGGTNAVDDRYPSTSVGPSPAGPAFPPDGRKPDVAAPGEGVRTASAGGNFGTASGTSMAAPHVTAAVALMLQANPDLSYDEVRELLATTSKDLGDPGYDHVFGYGRVDALAAVRGALRLRVRAEPSGGLVTHETGDTISIALRLRVAPASGVSLRIALADPTEGELLSDSLLEFSPESWDLPQSVVVRGAGDTLADGDVAYLLEASTASGDRLYDGLSLTLATITNVDAPLLGVVGTAAPAGSFRLLPNYPNPFNPSTVIAFDLPAQSRVSLRVFDLLGRVVAVLVDGMRPPGLQSARWEAAGAAGGVYICRLEAAALAEPRATTTLTQKLLLLR